MGDKIIIKGYHATNGENYSSINEEGFYISKNTRSKYHWLGNGIYLFQYPKDAESWSKDIENCKENPMILLVKAKLKEEEYLDLDNPEDMDKFQAFTQVLLEEIYNKDINKGELRFYSELQLVSWALNQYKSVIAVDLVKYTFSNTRTMNSFGYSTSISKYFQGKEQRDQFSWLRYPYNEVQLCLTSNNSIIDIKRYKEGN